MGWWFVLSLNLEDPIIHYQISWIITFLLSPIVFFILLIFKPSTYGKLYSQQSKINYFGRPSISSKYAWIIFESPCWIWTLYGYYKYYYFVVVSSSSSSNNDDDDDDDTTKIIPNKILLLLFCLHYIHRSLIYPMKISSQSQFPLGLMLFTIPYTITNGYLQTMNLCKFQTFPTDYMYSYQFIIGISIMVTGFGITYQSDQILLNLRRRSSSSSSCSKSTTTTGKEINSNQQLQQKQQKLYYIPYGGLFNYISMPHYFGEIIEWIGYMIACQYSLSTISFVIWTCSNLIPRAIQQHSWYNNNKNLKFNNNKEDNKPYPSNRKAIIPFIL